MKIAHNASYQHGKVKKFNFLSAYSKMKFGSLDFYFLLPPTSDSSPIFTDCLFELLGETDKVILFFLAIFLAL